MLVHVLSYGLGVLGFFIVLVMAAGASRHVGMMLLAHLLVSGCVVALDIHWVEAARTEVSQASNDRVLKSMEDMAAGAAARDTDLGRYLVDARLGDELRELESIANDLRQGDMSSEEGAARVRPKLREFEEPDFDALFVIGMLLRILIVNASLLPLGILARVVRGQLFRNDRT